jgi:hypothetical protein
MSKDTQPTSISAACRACGRAINDTSHLTRVRQLKQLGPTGQPTPEDAVVGHVHETCALKQDVALLRGQLDEAMGSRDQLLAVLATVTTKLGAVRFHQSDLKATLERQDELNIKTAPDGFITVEIKRSIIVPPTLLT